MDDLQELPPLPGADAPATSPSRKRVRGKSPQDKADDDDGDLGAPDGQLALQSTEESQGQGGRRGSGRARKKDDDVKPRKAKKKKKDESDWTQAYVQPAEAPCKPPVEAEAKGMQKGSQSPADKAGAPMPPAAPPTPLLGAPGTPASAKQQCPSTPASSAFGLSRAAECGQETAPHTKDPKRQPQTQHPYEC